MKTIIIFIFISGYCYCQKDTTFALDKSRAFDRYDINFKEINKPKIDSLQSEMRFCTNELNKSLYLFSDEDRSAFLRDISNSTQLFTINCDENYFITGYSVQTCKANSTFNKLFIECIKGIGKELLSFHSVNRVSSNENSFNVLLVIDDSGFIRELFIW